MPMFFTKVSRTLGLASSRYWVACLVTVNSGLVYSEVGVEKLHIPKSYIRHLPALFDGAQLMEQSERCQKFVEGTVNINNATLKHPVFRYTCRDQLSKTYHFLVDGLTFDIYDETRPSGKVSFDQLQIEINQDKVSALQAEQLKQEEMERLKAELQALKYLKSEALMQQDSRQEYLWSICYQRAQNLAKNMQDLEWMTGLSPEPNWIDEELQHYSIDFNASDYQGNKLEYRILCQLSSETDAKVSIHPRSLAQIPAPPSKNKLPSL